MQELILFSSAEVGNYLETVSCIKWPEDLYVEILSPTRAYLLGKKYFLGFKMVAKNSDQRTYFFILPDEIINILKEQLYLKVKWMVKAFSLLKFQTWQKIQVVMQRLKYVPVKFHIERTIPYEFIPLPGGVTLWSTGTLPYNGRSIRTLQQFGLHHWSGAGRKVQFVPSDCTEHKLTTSVTNKLPPNTVLMCYFSKTPSELNTFSVSWAKPRPHPCIGPLTVFI